MLPGADLYEMLQEPHCSSGSYMPVANRLLLMSLAMSISARDILETGTSTGGTTLAFAMTGAHVVTIEHDTQDVARLALVKERLDAYSNVERLEGDALFYLLTVPANSFDLIFLDDGHWPGYLQRELACVRRVLRPGGLLVCHDTLSCHLWDVIEGTLPATWQRLNMPSYQEGSPYTGTHNVSGQDFGLGIIRKPPLTTNPMEIYEDLPALPGHLPKIPYDIVVLQEHNTRPYERIGADGIEALVDYYTAWLALWRTSPDALAAPEWHHAEHILYGYGTYCAQRADEAMRRKFERMHHHEDLYHRQPD